MSTFDHLMGIAAVVAFVGAVGCLFLVRQRDFVPSLDEGEWGADAGDDPGTPGGAAEGGDERSTAAHAG